MYASIFISILILIAVLIPGGDIPDVGTPGVDKVVHVVMFMTWAVAVRYDVVRKPFPFISVFLLGIAFSVFSEFVQLLAEDRTFDIFDLAADAIGLILGLLVGGPVVRWVNRLW